MLVMGSQAAALRGDLPSWSSPSLTDYDIVGSRGEFTALREAAQNSSTVVIAHDRGNGRLGMRISSAEDFGDRVLEPAGTRVTQLAVSRNSFGFGDRLYYTVNDTTLKTLAL